MKKIAVITGASSGMGRNFAIQLSRDYQYLCIDEIWLLARRKDKLDSLAEEIKHIEGTPVPRPVQIDVSGKEGALKYKEIIDSEAEALKEKGGLELTVLVNNAGFGTYGPFEETPIERQLDMIELNCTGLTGICGYSLPYLNENSYVINTASMAAYSPLGNFAVYGASKAFVLSFTLALAAELEPKGVNVCALCPGSVSTEFANVASNGARKEVLHGFSSEKTIRHCLKRAFKGKKVAILRFKWKFQHVGSHFVSRFAVAKFTFKHSKRPYQKN